VKKRTIPNALHVYDIAVHNGIMFAAIGTDSTTNNFKVLMSRDMGETWSAATTESGRCHNFFELGGEIYAVTFLSNLQNPSWNNIVLRFDGTRFVNAPFNSAAMIPDTPVGTRLRMVRTAMLGSQLLYVGAQIDNQSQWDGFALFAASSVTTARRVTLPEATAKAYDVLVRGSTAYVLASVPRADGKHTIVVYSSQNATQWTELFRLTSDTFARSFEELNGDFYFGLGSNVASQSPITGDIMRIAKGAYSTSSIVAPSPSRPGRRHLHQHRHLRLQRRANTVLRRHQRLLHACPDTRAYANACSYADTCSDASTDAGANADTGTYACSDTSTHSCATPPPHVGNGNGLAVTYYDNQDFTGHSISRIDPQVNFSWNTGSPDSEIGVDSFSARWVGQVQAQRSEIYTFHANADDGVRLWVDGQLLIDQWKNQDRLSTRAALG
jgi:hypothetical protein